MLSPDVVLVCSFAVILEQISTQNSKRVCCTVLQVSLAELGWGQMNILPVKGEKFTVEQTN